MLGSRRCLIADGRADPVKVLDRGGTGDIVKGLLDRWKADSTELDSSLLNLFVGAIDPVAPYRAAMPTPSRATDCSTESIWTQVKTRHVNP